MQPLNAVHFATVPDTRLSPQTIRLRTHNQSKVHVLVWATLKWFNCMPRIIDLQETVHKCVQLREIKEYENKKIKKLTVSVPIKKWIFIPRGKAHKVVIVKAECGKNHDVCVCHFWEYFVIHVQMFKPDLTFQASRYCCLSLFWSFRLHRCLSLCLSASTHLSSSPCMRNSVLWISVSPQVTRHSWAFSVGFLCVALDILNIYILRALGLSQRLGIYKGDCRRSLFVFFFLFWIIILADTVSLSPSLLLFLLCSLFGFSQCARLCLKAWWRSWALLPVRPPTPSSAISVERRRWVDAPHWPSATSLSSPQHTVLWDNDSH